MRPGEDAAALSGQAMDGEATLFFPAFDGALVPAKKSGDFLPGVDPAILGGTPNGPGHGASSASGCASPRRGRGGISIAREGRGKKLNLHEYGGFACPEMS